MSARYSFSISVKKFWTIFVPIILLSLLLGAIGGFLLVDKAVMPSFTDLQNKNDVIVPSLIGLDVETAAQKAYDVGLVIVKKYREYSDVKPFNSIISQDPVSGESVKRGRHIFVTLSSGAEVGEIPEVRNLAEGPAKTALRLAGFENITLVINFDSRIAANFAIETNPPAKSRTSRDVPVTLYLSKGQRPTHANVPNLVGEMLSNAQAVLGDKGLKLGKVSFAASSFMDAGQIISQSLTPGSDVPWESSIDVVVTVER
jgi:serine/threonine-protein kinase